jgi:uncharacterized protein (TIGR02145 family)
MRCQDANRNFPICKLIGVLMIFAAMVSACDDDNAQKVSPPVTDIDGNEYKTVAIGSQVWMAENLKVISYNDGTGTVMYANSEDDLTSIATPAGTFYENNGANGQTYGILYNWHAVASGKLCPTGWHVPTDSEWNTLIDFLGGEDVAGGKMKEAGTAHWNSPNLDATNSSGFTALPAGYLFDNGNYNSLGNVTHWWTSTQSDTDEAFDRYVYFQNGKAVKGTYSKQVFYSCRCIKD